MRMQGVRTSVLAVCVGFVSLLSPTSGRSQTPAPTINDLTGPGLLVRLAHLIEAAEILGARFPRDSVMSSTVRRCVDATDSDVVSSGEMEVHGFSHYPEIWRRGYGKLSWWPARPALGDSLVVRIQRLGDSTAVVAFRSRHPTRTGRGDLIYPSGIHLPTPGDWLFIATAGTNWGCFAITLRG